MAGRKVKSNRSIPTNPDDFREYIYNRFATTNDSTPDVAPEITLASHICNKVTQARITKLLSLYELGMFVRGQSSELRQLCMAYGVSATDLGIGRFLTEKYPTMDECKKAYIASGCPALSTFVGVDKMRKPRYWNRPQDISTIYQAINKYLNADIEEEGENVKAALADLTIKLAQHFPVKKTYDNISYFQYAFCVGCGKECAQDKLLLHKHPSWPFVILPYCQECEAQGMPYNPELVIKLYALYVLQLEEYLNRLA